jgi:EpsD family peptidyl-prolyl cis-trans isomerase
MNTIRHTAAPSRPLLSALCAAVLLMLAACGKADEGAPAQASQVAAKVGSSEISVHQINQALSRTPLNANSKDAVQAASRAVLERLIDQQLAVDQATEQKLHRSPEVVAQLEAARREVLARAYLQQVTAASPKPTPEEIRQYYQEHPALFSERRVFNLQELRISNATPVMDALQAMAREGRRMDDVVALLRERGVAFTGGSATRAAEQVPLDLLPKLHALQDGQSLVVPVGDNATFIRVVASRSMPVTQEAAAPGIAQFLGNQRAAEVMGNEIKRLRAATTVTYVGEFEQASAAPDEAAPAAPAAPASVTQEPKKDEPSVLERGIQGLK